MPTVAAWAMSSARHPPTGTGPGVTVDDFDERVA
jgi:hypothetical protein